jgi:hypothetical protein
MRKFLQYLLVGSLAMGALGGLAACSSKSNSDKANDAVDQALRDNGVSVNTDNGDASIGSSSKVPDDFPDDVPLPEDGDLTSSFSTDTGDAKSFSLAYSFGNAGDVTDAADSYKSQLKDDSFDISSEFSSSSGGSTGTSFTASNDKYSVTVYASGGTGGSADDASLVVTVTPLSGN